MEIVTYVLKGKQNKDNIKYVCKYYENNHLPLYGGSISQPAHRIVAKLEQSFADPWLRLHHHL